MNKMSSIENIIFTKMIFIFNSVFNVFMLNKQILK